MGRGARQSLRASPCTDSVEVSSDFEAEFSSRRSSLFQASGALLHLNQWATIALLMVANAVFAARRPLVLSIEGNVRRHSLEIGAAPAKRA